MTHNDYRRMSHWEYCVMMSHPIPVLGLVNRDIRNFIILQLTVWESWNGKMEKIKKEIKNLKLHKKEKLHAERLKADLYRDGILIIFKLILIFLTTTTLHLYLVNIK